MLFKGTNSDDILQGTNGNDTLKGNAGDDSIFSGKGDDLVSGGAGNDSLWGGSADQDILVTGGSDTLTGGNGADSYFISLESGGGSVIKEDSADYDDASGVGILAENTDLNTIASFEFLDITDSKAVDQALTTLTDPDTWGDAAIELSRPEEGIIGLEKSGTSLIIDISRDGVAEVSDDLTITNYFDDQGNLGTGAPALINNIMDQQIVDFFG
jgi:hypothetical protein